MGLSDKTVRSYLDILTGTFLVQQLQPWHTNVGKRQVKAPRIYIRDSGVFKLTDAPRVTRSMRIALDDLELRHLWVVHAGKDRFPMDERITAWPLREIPGIAAAVATSGLRRTGK